MTAPSSPLPDQSPDKITPSKSLEPDQAIRQSQSGTSFESHMQKGTPPQGTPQAAGSPNPMQIARPSNMQMGTPSMDSLTMQAKTAQDSLGTVEQQIKTPNLKLKRSQAHLLKNKLTDAQEYSRAAAAKLGVETPPMKPPSGGMLDRFLGYINDGQDQFVAIQSKLAEMSASGKQLDAGDMMLMQAKMNVAQQEVEYSSTLLSKVISSITTIMNIQL